jgi:hypothetical protein
LYLQLSREVAILSPDDLGAQQSAQAQQLQTDCLRIGGQLALGALRQAYGTSGDATITIEGANPVLTLAQDFLRQQIRIDPQEAARTLQQALSAVLGLPEITSSHSCSQEQDLKRFLERVTIAEELQAQFSDFPSSEERDRAAARWISQSIAQKLEPLASPLAALDDVSITSVAPVAPQSQVPQTTEIYRAAMHCFCKQIEILTQKVGVSQVDAHEIGNFVTRVARSLAPTDLARTYPGYFQFLAEHVEAMLPALDGADTLVGDLGSTAQRLSLQAIELSGRQLTEDTCSPVAPLQAATNTLYLAALVASRSDKPNIFIESAARVMGSLRESIGPGLEKPLENELILVATSLSRTKALLEGLSARHHELAPHLKQLREALDGLRS